MWLLLIAVGTGYLARCWQSSRKTKTTISDCGQTPRQQSKGQTIHGSQPKTSTSTDKRLIYSEVQESSGPCLKSRDVYIDGQNRETEEGGGVGVEEVDNSSMAIDRKRKKEYGSQPFDQVSLVKLLSKECVGSHQMLCISANRNLREEGGSTLINDQLSEDWSRKSSKTQEPISDIDGTSLDNCPFIQRANLISTFSEIPSVLELQFDSDCGREESRNQKSRRSAHLSGSLLKIGNEDGSTSEHSCSKLVTDIAEPLFESQSHQMLCISANRNLREEGRSALRNDQISEDCANKSSKIQEPISDFEGTSLGDHLVIPRANPISTFLERSSVLEPRLDSDCGREEGRNQKSRRLTHLFGNHLKFDNKDGSTSEHRGSKLVTDIVESSRTSTTTRELNSHLDGSYSSLGLSPDAFVSGFLESSRCHHENEKEKKKKMRGKALKRKDFLKLQGRRRRPFHRKAHLSSWVLRNEFVLGSCLKAYALDGNANGGKTCFSRWFWLQACMGSDYGGFSALEGVRIADSKGNLLDAERRIDDNCPEKKALPQIPHFRGSFSDISSFNQGTLEVKKSSNDISVASSSLQPSGFGYNMIRDAHINDAFTAGHITRTTAGVHHPITPNAAELGSASDGGLLFHFGVGIGAMLMMTASRDEMKRLCESMKETKELVNDLRRKFDSSKLERLQMLRLNDNASPEESHFFFSQLNDCQAKLEIPVSNGVHLVQGFDSEYNNSSRSVLTEEVARGNNNNMSILEAELEAELQQMEFSLDRRRHDNKLHISSFEQVGKDYWAAPSEYEESSDSECTGGPLNSYAVSAVELERRLWRIIEKRHEELENTLETTEQKLTAKEEELHGWKERVRYLTNVSVGYSTGDGSLSDEASSQISCEELLMSGFEDIFPEKTESLTELWEIQGGCL